MHVSACKPNYISSNVAASSYAALAPNWRRVLVMCPTSRVLLSTTSNWVVGSRRAVHSGWFQRRPLARLVPSCG